jgi:hypothetical protein
MRSGLLSTRLRPFSRRFHVSSLIIYTSWRTGTLPSCLGVSGNILLRFSGRNRTHDQYVL